MSESAKSAAAREREQRQTYAAWVAALPESERRKIQATNKSLLRPMSGGALGGRVNVRNDGAAGEFADCIGANLGEVEIGEIEVEVSIEDRRFDELVALAPKGVTGQSARQFVRNIMAADAKIDRGAIGYAGGSLVSEAAREISSAVWREMLRDARDAKQPRLRLRVLLMALGWADESVESGRALARDYVLSPEQASNMLEEAQQKYRLPKNQFNKSAEATAKYKGTNGK